MFAADSFAVETGDWPANFKTFFHFFLLDEQRFERGTGDGETSPFFFGSSPDKIVIREPFRRLKRRFGFYSRHFIRREKKNPTSKCFVSFTRGMTRTFFFPPPPFSLFIRSLFLNRNVVSRKCNDFFSKWQSK